MGARLRSRCAASLLAIAVVAGGALGASGARAQSAVDKARAEALFDEGRRLMADGKYADACPKFAASQALDPGVGTMLNLARCYELNGQTASAWATYIEAATAANGAGQTDRAKFARDHAAALEPVLAKLTVVLASGVSAAGLEVRIDGSVLASAELGTPVPVDPGNHVVEARAAGKQTSTQNVHVDAKQSQTVTIAALVAVAPPPPTATTTTPPEPPPTASTTPPPPPTSTAPPPPASTQSPPPPPPPPPTATTARPVPAPPPPGPPAAPQPERGGLQRSLGGWGVAIGTIALAGGGIAALSAFITYGNTTAPGQCDGNNQCTQKGLDNRATSYTLASFGTGLTIGGGALLATGIVLLLTAPSATPAAAAKLRIHPTGASLEGSF
jgi:serine/threonine-protein kinase